MTIHADIGTNATERLVQAYYREVDSAPHEVYTFFADGATYHRPGYPELRGRAEISRFYAEARVIKSGTHELHMCIVKGLTAAVRGTFRGVLRDDSPVETRFADFFVLTHCSDGLRIGDRWTYFSGTSV
jgi:ketosteroid isomerase-like protein